MGKIKTLELTSMQQSALENGYHSNPSHAFRRRCRAVILKSKGLSSSTIGIQLEMHPVSVSSRVKRFGAEGINGLKTRPGRVRKPIIGTRDEEIIRQAIIEKDRPGVLAAKARREAATGKTACTETPRRFLSASAQDLDV